MRFSFVALLILGCGSGRDQPEQKARERPPVAQTVPAPARAPSTPPTPTLPCPMMWSVEKGGVTSYAFGTVHLGITAQQLPAVVTEKLASVPHFAIERDLYAPINNTRMKSTHSLSADLGPEYTKKLAALLGASTTRGIDHMQPYVAVILIARSFRPVNTSLDAALLATARSGGREVHYLEEPGVALDALEKHLDLASLKRTLDDPKHDREIIDKIIAAYEAGDADAMEQALDEDDYSRAHGMTDEELAARAEAIFFARNASWVAPFTVMHDGGGAFVAVGSGHLVGKRSLLELLGKRGFVVTRVPCVTTSTSSPVSGPRPKPS